jgi:hypothetical protein
MASFSPIGNGVSASVKKAIDDLLAQAMVSGVMVIDARSEADRIRSSVAGAAVLSSDELTTMIGLEGAKLGIGLEFR